MNQEEVFSVWAPHGSIWSRWVAPVLVVQSYWQARIKAVRAPARWVASARLPGTRPADKGTFDNRWMVFPQDFPSARFLVGQGIRHALLVQKDRAEPQDDLAHSLLRWQEGGIKVQSKKLDDN